MALTTDQKEELEQLIEVKGFSDWLMEGYAREFIKDDEVLKERVNKALEAVESLQDYLSSDLDLEVYF